MPARAVSPSGAPRGAGSGIVPVRTRSPAGGHAGRHAVRQHERRPAGAGETCSRPPHGPYISPPARPRLPAPVRHVRGGAPRQVGGPCALRSRPSYGAPWAAHTKNSAALCRVHKHRARPVHACPETVRKQCKKPKAKRFVLLNCPINYYNPSLNVTPQITPSVTEFCATCTKYSGLACCP